VKSTNISRKYVEAKKSRSTSLFPQREALIILVGATVCSQLAAAEDGHRWTEGVPNYTVGTVIGTAGLGASFSGKSSMHFVDGDQIQWRLMLGGMAADDFDEAEFNDIEYEDSDFSAYTLQVGFDWYPFQGWAEPVFVSAGLLYSEAEFDGKADTDQSFTVGNTVVIPGDITALTTEVEQDGVSPYFSIGWGNKISGKRGFSFQTEIGVAIPTSDADVELRAEDPNSFLSAADLAREEKDIEEDVNGPSGFFSFSLTYQF